MDLCTNETRQGPSAACRNARRNRGEKKARATFMKSIGSLAGKSSESDLRAEIMRFLVDKSRVQSLALICVTAGL